MGLNMCISNEFAGNAAAAAAAAAALGSTGPLR